MQDVPWGLNLFFQKTRAIPSTVLGWGGRAYIPGIHIYTNNSILPTGIPKFWLSASSKRVLHWLEAGVIGILTQASGDNGRFLGPTLLCCWSSSAKVILKLPDFWTCWLSPAIPQRLSALPQQQWSSTGKLPFPCHKSQSLQVSDTKEARLYRPGPEKGPCICGCAFLSHFPHSISISSWLQWRPLGQ